MKEGYKKTELDIIPTNWDVYSLKDISIGKGQYGIGASATEYVHGNPRYLRITDIGDGGRLLNNDIKGLEEDNYKDYLLEYGDIVFARTGNTTGKSYVYENKDGELVYAGFLIKFKMNEEVAYSGFIKYVIQSKRYWDWVNVMSTRSGQPGINSNEYATFQIQIPPLKEQQKIAKILSNVDSQIDDTDKLIEKTRELKKGLMQRLLTKGIGHKEFKMTEIGEIPVAWEVNNLNEIVDICYGKSQKEVEVSNGKYKILGTGGVIGYTNNFLWNKPSVLIGRKGTIDKPQYIEEPFWTVDTLFYTKIKDNDLAKWLFYYLSNIDLKKYNEATGVPSLSVSNLNFIKVAVPSLKEQREIVEILSSVDTQIEEYENKKTKLEEFKKGLMQQLLIGRVRVV